MSRFVRLAALASTSVVALSARPMAAHVPPEIPSALYSALSWRCVGPFGGGPVASVSGIAGEPGIYIVTTPSGGTWKTVDGGDTWTSIGGASHTPTPTDPHRWIDPANPRRIVRTDEQGIAVSLDAGATWMASHHLPIAEVSRLSSHSRDVDPTPRAISGRTSNVSIADPSRAGLIFAGTNDGMYVSFDGGVGWQSLQLNLPPAAITDLDIRGNDLVAATRGRSIWTLDDIAPLRQLTPASASAAAVLFKPSDALLPAGGSDASAAGIALDYYLGASPGQALTLEVLDATGRVVQSAGSAAPDAGDRWLPVIPPLQTSPGHHRVVWDLRMDPPPSPHHRFEQLARTLFEDEPADPEGPRVLAGAYTVRLTAGGHVYTQPLVVRGGPGADVQAARQQFELAMRTYDAMEVAHRGFIQLRRVRDRVKALLVSPDPDIAAAATALDARLNDIDGSDWTGLVIPDADDELGEVDEAKEGKHPDFVPPKAVSLSKDYDDPTSILGRAFGNVDHAPAFAILGTKLGEMLTRLGRDAAAPDAAAAENFSASCRQLAGVLATWQSINAQDLPWLNAELATRRLAPLPVAASVPSIACSPK